MNKTFADHVTNTAFFLSISKKQCLMLMHLFNNPWDETCKSIYVCNHPHYNFNIEGTRDTWIITFQSLARKGLVENVSYYEEHKGSLMSDAPPKMVERGYWKLTEAGRLTCLLLIEAGLGMAKQPQEQAA